MELKIMEKYNMNVVRSDIVSHEKMKIKSENDDMNDAPVKDFALKLITYRHENGKLDDYDLDLLKYLFKYNIRKRIIYNEKEGMIHYTDDNEYQSRYNNVRESLNFTKMELKILKMKDLDVPKVKVA